MFIDFICSFSVGGKSDCSFGQFSFSVFVNSLLHVTCVNKSIGLSLLVLLSLKQQGAIEPILLRVHVVGLDS